MVSSRRVQDVDNWGAEQILESLRQEIEYTEKSIVILEQRIHMMLQQPMAELGKVARMNMQLGEIKAYLNGLNFTAGLLGNADRFPKAEHEETLAGAIYH